MLKLDVDVKVLYQQNKRFLIALAKQARTKESFRAMLQTLDYSNALRYLSEEDSETIYLKALEDNSDKGYTRFTNE